jgi:hypothetical protein
MAKKFVLKKSVEAPVVAAPEEPKAKKKVIKLKKVPEPAQEPAQEPVAVPVAVAPMKKTKAVIKLKKKPEPVPEPVPEPETKKKAITLSKKLPIPTFTEPLTKAMEAFEALREYYELRNEPIPQSDIKWIYEELEQEKKADAEFWADCPVTKAHLDAIYRGATQDELEIAVAKAQIEEKKKPIKDTDLGPMPSYGTQEFWIWCHKRKQIRLQKEAAIIAAGGTVPEVKPKKPRVKKVEKVTKD